MIIELSAVDVVHMALFQIRFIAVTVQVDATVNSPTGKYIIICESALASCKG